MSRPIFIVAPPRSGGALLAEAFRESPSVVASSRSLDAAIASLCGEQERLTSETATPAVIEALRAEESRIAGSARLLDSSPLHAWRVPFLHAVFPDAAFVYIYRDPRRAVHDLLNSGVPAVEAARRWDSATATVLDDLERLPPGAWMIAAWHGIRQQPGVVLPRIADFLGIAWNGQVPADDSADDSAASALANDLDAVDGITRKTADRARDLFASPPPRPSGPANFRSVATPGVAQILRSLGISLVVSTYQSGRLILLRAESENTLNTHFRMFSSPMGVAVGNGRMAIGTAREVWDYRNVPALAAKIEPAGKHDACYVPRKIHVTGDIRVHEIGFASGELWIVNTRFSALCTLDSDSNFVPRWRPPFITSLAAEDRCHLNGMAIVGGRVRYVTALGATDTPGGWRSNKASGGLLLDVESGEQVLRGLSMPHSPRQHDGRFFILESGKGTIATADLGSGRVDTIAELPGFTRGLAFAGPFAFVGLSQVRESNVFGGIPLTDRVAERQCGIWVVDLRSGRTVGFLRFEGDVQEIFDVQVLHGLRHPDLLELTDPLVATSYAVPDETLAQFAR